MTEIQSTRTFRLWEYRVSHDQLLLRSAKTEANPRNLDVIFVGVELMRLPTRLDGLEIKHASPKEIAQARMEYGKDVSGGRVFTILSEDRRYLVVAAGLRAEENEFDVLESSLESFST